VIAATSREVTASLRRVLLASALVALTASATQRAQAQPVVLRHQTMEGHFTVHSLTLSPSGRPHALISSAPDRYAAGPQVLSVLSAGEGHSMTRVTELRTLAQMGPLAELAVGANGEYALAASDVSGLLFSLHAPDGTQRVELERRLSDHVPIALFGMTGGFILVTNRGHYVIDEEGEVVFEEAAPEGTYTAAAVEMPGAECRLVSLLVEPATSRWLLRRHCLGAKGFKLQSSVNGPATAAPSHRLRLSASASEVLVTAASAAEQGKWVLVRCTLVDSASCASSSLPDVPANPILAVKGLPLFILPPSTAVLLAPTDDGRALWLARVGTRQERPLSARVLSLPGNPRNSTALLESLTLRQSGKVAWYAVAYSDWDQAADVSSTAPRQRSSIVMGRIDPASIPPRRR
jgi:hypothetical protein